MAKYRITPSSKAIIQLPISIGHKAEKGVEAIEFDLTAWVETYGSGTLTVIMRRWGDAIPYPIALEIDENNKATWTLSDIDTAKAGMAYAQLSYIVGDEVVKKSDIYTFRVMDSLVGEGDPPEAYESWLEQLTHLAAEAMAEVLDIEGIVTDKTLTVDGGIADGKATGDALSALEDQFSEETDKLKADLGDSVDSDNGLFNLDSYLFSESTEDIAFVRGMRGGSAGDSCEVVGNNYFSCTNLIPVSDGDILTVVNLMPTKFRFNVRGYTENEENSGVLISGGSKVLNADLTESGSYSTDYSNTINAVYKNTVEIIKPLATAKYISVHARTFGAVNSTDKDREELNRCVRVIRKSPTLNSVFLPSVPPAKLPSEIPLANIPKITSAKRTKLGQYAELVGYGYVTINTANKTMAVGAGFTLKSGKTRVNNPTIDFSELTTGHQTIYYDMTDSTIKITGYAAYQNLENIEDTLYLGSVWAANTTYPVGYFSINTNMDIVVDGVKQLPRLSYFCGKTIACFGDSICLGRTTSSGTTTHLLQDILSKEYGIKATNYAVGGACWAHRTGMSHDLSALVPASTIDTDFILLFAGTNDYGTNRQLGTIDDAPSGDEGNTFYAAMHYVLQHIFTQKPNAEVAIVTPTFRSYVSSGGSGDTYNTVRNSAGCTLGDYSDAMIEVAKLYNVPILDMRKMGPINKFNYASMLEEQSEGDHLYLHPKDATYDILYHKICNWLMTVL